MGLVPTAKDIEDMPISINDLKGLFTFLDEKSISGFECNHTFKLTESYLSNWTLAKSGKSEPQLGRGTETQFNNFIGGAFPGSLPCHKQDKGS